MKKTTAWYWALFSLVFVVVAIHGQDEKKEKAQPQAKMMSDLSDGDIAVSMYGEDLTWGKMQELMKRDGVPLRKNADGSLMPAPIKTYLQRMVKNAISLHAAKEQGYVLSEAERAYYLDGIKKTLRENLSDEDSERILARYPKEGKSLYDPSLEDLLLVAKFNSKIVEGVRVNGDEIEAEANRIKAGNVAVEAFNKQMRQTMKEILSRPESKTDEGFASLAKEYSEGKEAENGGVIEGEFPRNFVAAACELDEFNLKAGETSDVLESGTAFRALRVLKVLPPKHEGGDERVRIAQIILTKYPINDELPPEKLKESLLASKKEKTLEEYALRQMVESSFSCPLFPHGMMSDGQ